MTKQYVRMANEVDVDFITMYLVELLASPEMEQESTTHLTYVLNNIRTISVLVAAESKQKIEYVFEYVSPIDEELCIASMTIPFQNN